MQRIISILTIFLAYACTSNRQVYVKEYFDEATYTAVVRADRSALFVARDLSISSHGGDMISVGPVYTVLSTTHKQALWLGFWTTLDRHGIDHSRRSLAESVFLVADGVDIKLSVDKEFSSAKHTNWQTYPEPAPGTINRYFIITNKQLKQLAEARTVMLRIPEENKSNTVYDAANNLNPIIGEFLEQVE